MPKWRPGWHTHTLNIRNNQGRACRNAGAPRCYTVHLVMYAAELAQVMWHCIQLSCAWCIWLHMRPTRHTACGPAFCPPTLKLAHQATHPLPHTHLTRHKHIPVEAVLVPPPHTTSRPACSTPHTQTLGAACDGLSGGDYSRVIGGCTVNGQLEYVHEENPVVLVGVCIEYVDEGGGDA
jgi:hypothetical protein